MRNRRKKIQPVTQTPEDFNIRLKINNKKQLKKELKQLKKQLKEKNKIKVFIFNF